MEFTKNGSFKVGNTTLQTPIQIRIPEYGYELPEIHASSPLSMPIYTAVANIINWLERGIAVEFCDSKNAERVLFFIMEYNRFAREENKKIENAEEHYKIALNAQNILYSQINYKHDLIERSADEKVPFGSNLYKGIKKSRENDKISLYKNPFMRKNKNTNEPSKKKDITPLKPGDVYAFDVFSIDPETLTIEAEEYPDIVFD
jgi:hypothetical protein